MGLGRSRPAQESDTGPPPPSPRDGASSTASHKSLAEGHENAELDGDAFDVPKPWVLLAMAILKCVMTMLTVSGAFFFLLADPEKLTPRCYRWSLGPRIMCTTSAICFWTYPVLCCMVSVTMFKRYLVDARTYYEFLLHEVAISYPSLGIIAYAFCRPGLPTLMVYAFMAFSAFFWKSATAHVGFMNHVFSGLAYLAPILSFISVMILNWTVEGNIMTLPVFLVQHHKATQLLSKTRPYSMEDLGRAYAALEIDFQEEPELEVTTGRMIALVEEKLHNTPHLEQDHIAGWFYRPWNERMLDSKHLVDERSRIFRYCVWAYTVWHVITRLVGIVLLFCTTITALDLTRAIDLTDPHWSWAASYTLGTEHGQWQAIAVRAHINAARSSKFMAHGAFPMAP